MSSMEAVLKKYRTIVNQEVLHSFISLGPISVNLAANRDVRGVQGGKIIQITGRESSGKTTLCVDIARQYLDAHSDKFVLWVDFERSVDVDYFTACGLNMERFIRLTPDCAEDGLNAVTDFIRDAGVQLVIIDSVAFAVPQAHEGKKFGESFKMAAVASLMTDFCKRMVPLIDNKDATILLINQMRKNMNPMAYEEEIPFGGMAIQQATNITLHLRRTKRNEGVGQTVEVLVKKNKQNAPQTRAEFDIVYGKGIDHAASILNTARDLGIVSLSGSWYRYGELSAQGITKAVQVFPLNEIVSKIQQQGGQDGLDATT